MGIIIYARLTKWKLVNGKLFEIIELSRSKIIVFAFWEEKLNSIQYKVYADNIQI